MTPEPKHISGPSGLSEHKPATQAMIRARRTGFELIHAYKEVVYLAVGGLFCQFGEIKSYVTGQSYGRERQDQCLI